MPFFIVNANGIYLQEYSSYEQAGADCEAGEFVYLADSMNSLEEILQAEVCSQDDFI
ncbi:MAG: hypothetical protein GXY49_10045 [Syntrophomonadaceae bacterium]|nr:hypothetical protein [Syntrophomonadaceae bacterium]